MTGEKSSGTMLAEVNVKRIIIIIILLLLTYFVMDGKTIPLPDVLRPEFIEIYQNRVYIVEGPQVHIYRLKDFSHIKTFGREGEGPQEFKTHPTLGVRLTFDKNNLLVTSLNKLSVYDLTGNYQKETATAFLTTGGLFPVQHNGTFFLSDGRYREGKIAYNTMNLYDAQFKKVKEIAKYVKNEQRGRKIDPMNPGFPKYQVYDNKIFSEESDRVINVFASDGQKITTITPKDEERPITKAYKDRFFAFLDKWDPQEFDRLKGRFLFPANFPVIHNFKVADHRVYIVTWKQKKGAQEIKILSFDNKLIKTAYCPNLKANPMYLAPFTIAGGKIYHLHDNPDTETWELMVTIL